MSGGYCIIQEDVSASPRPNGIRDSDRYSHLGAAIKVCVAFTYYFEIGRQLYAYGHPNEKMGCCSRHLSVKEIQDEVAADAGMNRTKLLSKSRFRNVARSRQIAIFLCREFTGLSQPALAACFGGLDHTTIFHAQRRIGELCASDKDVRIRIDRLRERLMSCLRGTQ